MMALVERETVVRVISGIADMLDEKAGYDAAAPYMAMTCLVRDNKEAIPDVDAVYVVRCHQCESCTLLADGAGFHCAAWDTDFYAPYYDVTEYYCADGKRRDEPCT